MTRAAKSVLDGPSAPKGQRSEADERGRFGEYGGRYVPETLIAALDELTEAYPRISQSPILRIEKPASMMEIVMA